MAKRFFFLASLVFVMTIGVAQDFTKHGADSMLVALDKSKSAPARIDLLLYLAQYHIFKTGELPKDLDTAMTYVKEAARLIGPGKTSSAYGHQLLTEAYLYREKGEREVGRKKAEEAIAVLEAAPDKTQLGRAYFEMAVYFDIYVEEQCVKKTALIQKSIDAFQLVRNYKGKARSLELLGDIYLVDGRFEEAKPLLEAALVAYDSAKFTETQGVYVLLGDVYFDTQEFGKALTYLLKALKIAQLHNDSSAQMCQIYNSIGILYFRIDRLDIELKYLAKGLEYAKKNNDQAAVFLLISNIASAYTYTERGDLAIQALNSIPPGYLESASIYDKTVYYLGRARAYLQLRQPGNAKPYCDSALAYAEKKLLQEFIMITTYRTTANYYFLQQRYANARHYLQKAIEIADRLKLETAIVQNLALTYKLDSAQGNMNAAFNHLVLYKQKTDSINSERKVRQFDVLSVEYEVGMKEDSIKLKDKDILLLTQRNKQAGLVKNVTIGGILLALLIIGLLYRQYWIKQKNNRVVTQKNEQLQHYLDEKEWLLKEIHHRVKNNLQIVMSLLNSQSAFIDSQPALRVIHDSQHRIHAMSLIHQKLYNTENLSTIDISVYIREMVSYLAESFATGQRIRFEFAIEPLEMDVSQAVPLGLILNEAITNAIKYAFPGDRDGVISISISNTSAGQYLLIISDNGIGIPAHLAEYKQGSLGMSLMEGLSEDLDGHFTIGNDNGTTIRVTFVQEMAVKRSGTLTPSLVSHN